MSVREREKLIRNYICLAIAIEMRSLERGVLTRNVRRGLIPADDQKSEQWSPRSMMTRAVLVISTGPNPNWVWADCPMLARGDMLAIIIKRHKDLDGRAVNPVLLGATQTDRYRWSGLTQNLRNIYRRKDNPCGATRKGYNVQETNKTQSRDITPHGGKVMSCLIPII